MSKAKKLLSVLLAVALLMTTVSVAFTAFAADVDSVKASIDAYTGNGKVSSKPDPAFKEIADEYVKLTSAQKEELGTDRVIKMTGNAYNYININFAIPDDTPQADKDKGKDYVMWKAIDAMIGYTDAQQEAFAIAPIVLGNVEFTPKGTDTAIKFNALVFDDTDKGKACVAGVQEMLKLYTDSSDLAKAYLDNPYYRNGYFYYYNYAYYGYNGSQKLLDAAYKYQRSLITIPAIEEPAAPKTPEITKEEADMMAQIEELKQQRKDEGKTVVADQELYRKLTALQTKLTEYRRTTKAAAFASDEAYAQYIESLKKYEKDYREYYYDYDMKYIAAPYQAALDSMKLPKEYKDALAEADKFADAILAFEANPSKTDAVEAAAQVIKDLPETTQKFLKNFKISNVSTKFSKIAKASTSYKTGVLALTSDNMVNYYVKSFTDADKLAAYQEFLKMLTDTGYTMTSERASELYQKYGSVDTYLKMFLTAEQSAMYTMVGAYAALGNYYPKQDPNEPTDEINNFKPTDVAYDFGVSESRMEDIVGLLNTTVLDLMKSNGFGKEDLYKMIFTNANLTQLMMLIMPLLEEAAAGMSGLEGSIFKSAITPTKISGNLKETDYADAAAAMKTMSNWTTPTEETKAAYLASSYGFEDGDAQAFIQAFSAHLRNLWSLLSIANIKLEDTYNKDGSLASQGVYSYTVVPLFDAIGVKEYPTPFEFAARAEMENAANSTKDGLVLSIFEPLIGFVDQILAAPVTELLELLPNLIYQLDSGNIGNILVGVFDKLGSIGSGVDQSVKDTLKNLNSGLLYDLVSDLLAQGFEVPAIGDFTSEPCTLKLKFSKELWDSFMKDLAHCGTATAVPSKSVENAFVFRVEANKADVLTTAADFLINVLKENRPDWMANIKNLNELEMLLMGVAGMDRTLLLSTIFNAVLPEADYSAVNKAVASIPADLSVYTDESVAKVNEAKDAIVYGLSSQRQEEVDAMAKNLEKAVKALEKKPDEPTKPTEPSKPTDPSKPVDPSKPGDDGNDGNGGNGDTNLPTTGDKLLAIAGVAVVGAAAAFLLTKKKKED